MNRVNDDSVQPRTLLAGGAVKTRIALASGLVLTIGAWLVPRAAQTDLSTPQEHAAPLLEEQAQLREVSRPFVGVQEVAAPVRQHSVAILLPVSPAVPSRNDYSESAGGSRSVAGFGVFVSDTHVLTHSAALDGRSTADLSLDNGLTTRGEVVTYEPPTGLVLLQVQRPEGRAPVTLASNAPTPGAYEQVVIDDISPAIGIRPHPVKAVVGDTIVIEATVSRHRRLIYPVTSQLRVSGSDRRRAGPHSHCRAPLT